MMDYRTEVIVKKITSESWLVTYLDPKTSNEACKKMLRIITMTGPVRLDQPDPFEYLKPYQEAYTDRCRDLLFRRTT